MGAETALHNLLSSAPEPPAEKWAWEGELPPMVARSEADEDWSSADEFWVEKEDAQPHAERAAEAEAPPNAAAAAEQTGVQQSQQGTAAAKTDAPKQEMSESQRFFKARPRKAQPLVLCQVAFKNPQKSKIRGFNQPEGLLLDMDVGDLVRVMSLLDAPMYYGYVE